MIFFCVWLRVYSREVLRESFDFPKTFTITGILGTLGILVAGCPSIVELVSLTSSLPHIQHTEPKKQTTTIPSLPSPLPVAGLLALTSSNPQAKRNEPKPRTPATLRPAADLPRPSADGSQRPGYAPPHNPPDE